MFETAVVDEPSVFEPLKFYCISGRASKLKVAESFPMKVFHTIPSNYVLIS